MRRQARPADQLQFTAAFLYLTLTWIASSQTNPLSAWLPDMTMSIETEIWRTDAQPNLTNPSAIHIGTALTLDCCSRHSKLARELQRGYELFMEWANVVRGGVMVQGVRRPLKLTTVDDHSSEDLVQNITQRLLEDGVQLFLGPYGSALSSAAADALNSSGDALMVLPSSVDASILRDSPLVFGMLPPPHLWLQSALTALKGLGAASVTVLQEDLEFPAAVCNGVPDLAAQLGLTIASRRTVLRGVDLNEVVQTSFTTNSTVLDVLVSCAYDVGFAKDLLKALQLNDINFKAVVFATSVAPPGFLRDFGESARFVIGVSPWEHWFTPTSKTTSDLASDFSTIYAKRYATEAPYQAAAAFAAGAVLVAALEAANSTEPSAMAAALRTLRSQSVLGSVSFDVNGMNLITMKAFQHNDPDSRPLVVAPRSEEVETMLFYPAPPWDLRPCFIYTRPVHSAFGLINQSAIQHCTRCPDGYLAEWTENMWFGASAWRCVDKACPAGHGIADHHHCAECGVGKFGLASRRCQTCAPGKFSNATGGTACHLCPPGSFAATAGVTTCTSCAPGFQSSQHGQMSCQVCQPGRYAPMAGIVHCIQCSKGKISTFPGASACIGCEAGKFSAWGSRSCEECPVGRYQQTAEESACLSCPTGTSCKGLGSTHAANLENWWALNSTLPEGRTLNEWHACLEKGTCLQGELCREGHTGILCRVCLPGYAHNVVRHDCRKCPSLVGNVVTLLFILAGACFITYEIAAVSIAAAASYKTITDALIKIFISYLSTMSIMGILFRRELKTRLLLIFQAQPDIEYEEAGISMSAAVASFIMEAHSYFISVECLVQPQLSKQELQTVNELATAKHSEYFLPQYREAREILRDFHYSTELHLLLSCSFAPLVLTLLLLFFGACYTRFHMVRKKKAYKHVGAFVNDVLNLGWKDACQFARARHEDYEGHMALLETRILGIWNGMLLARAQTRTQACNIWLAASKPLLLVVFFLSYPHRMLAAMRPQNCVYPLNGLFGARLESAYDVEGYQNDLLYWYSAILVFVNGLAMPFVCGLILLGLRDQIHLPRFQRRYGFLIVGYKTNYCWWESLVLTRQGLGYTVIAFSMSQGMRVFVMLCLSQFFTLLHIWCAPYDHRFDMRLFRVERRHLVCWILSAWILLGMHMLPHDAPQEAIWICSLMLVIVHGWFCVMMLGQIGRQLRNNYAEHLLQRAHFEQFKRVLARYLHIDHRHHKHHHHHHHHHQRHGHAVHTPRHMHHDSEHSHGSIGTEPTEIAHLPHEVEGDLRGFSQWILRSYSHYLDRLPYIALNKDFAWCQLIGNKGSECKVPQEFDVNTESGLHFIPAQIKLPQGSSIKASVQARRHLVKVIREAFEYIIVNSDITVFSSTLLEFVLRAGFTFGCDSELRRIVLRSDSCFPSVAGLGEAKPESAAAAEVKKLLAESAAAAMSHGNPSSHSITHQASQKSDHGQSSQVSHKFTHQGSTQSNANEDKLPLDAMRNDFPKLARHMCEHMFEDDTFLRGVTLEEFQLSIAKSIMTRSSQELRIWFDAFETKWLEHQSIILPWEVTHKMRDEADAEIQVISDEITKDINGVDAQEMLDHHRDLKSIWVRFTRQLCLIDSRHQARVPYRMVLKQKQTRCVTMQNEILEMATKSQVYSTDIDVLARKIAEDQMRLVRTREELASLKAERKRAALEIEQLEAELARQGNAMWKSQGESVVGVFDSAVAGALDDAAALAVEGKKKPKR